MSQALQRTHKHAIKREPGAGERIRLTFRHLTHAPPPVAHPPWGAVDGAATRAVRGSG
jgi:hypothetical protein